MFWKFYQNPWKIPGKEFIFNKCASWRRVTFRDIFDKFVHLFVCALCYLYVMFLEAEKNFRAQQQQQQQQQTKKDQIIHFL